MVILYVTFRDVIDMVICVYGYHSEKSPSWSSSRINAVLRLVCLHGSCFAQRLVQTVHTPGTKTYVIPSLSINYQSMQSNGVDLPPPGDRDPSLYGVSSSG